MNKTPVFYPKDFIETAEGLLFAVVIQGLEDGKVLCCLRYVLEDSGWKKYPTHAANTYLQAYHPHYLHFSMHLAADLHAVGVAHISKHHQPRRRLQNIIKAIPQDAVEQDVYQLAWLLKKHGLDLAVLGVTGSVLAGVHNPFSDIDLVCYDRTVFQHCRTLVRDLIAQGKMAELTETDWQQSYRRREADLSYEEYLWHERRKHNKAMINGRKFDLSLLNASEAETEDCQKHGAIKMQCRIIDDTYSYDYPAKFITDHPTIQTVISYTATYVGQAQTGDWVEVSGNLEQTATGLQRIVVGSNREARGEYIKVKREI